MGKRGGKNMRRYYNNGAHNRPNFNDSYYLSSQGLRDVNDKVDELLAFPSQDFGKCDERNTRQSQNLPFGRFTQDFESQSKLDKILSHVESLNSKFDLLSREVSSLKQQLTGALLDIRDLKTKNQSLERELNALKSSPDNNSTSPAMNEIQKEVRQRCLLFSGPGLKIPQVPNPQLLIEAARITLKRVTGFDLTPNLIDDCRRFGKDKKDHKILLTFSSVLMKEEVLSKYITRERDPDAVNTTNNDLYVNEFLSQEQAQIFYNMRQLKKNEDFKDQIYSVFTRRGITAYKLKSDSTPKFLRSTSNIEDLKTKLQNDKLQSNLRRSNRVKTTNASR